MYVARLTYFRENGKYYSQAEVISHKNSIYEIWEDIKNRLKGENWPGLINRQIGWYVLIEVPGHPNNHPLLILTDRIQTLDKGT